VCEDYLEDTTYVFTTPHSKTSDEYQLLTDWRQSTTAVIWHSYACLLGDSLFDVAGPRV